MNNDDLRMRFYPMLCFFVKMQIWVSVLSIKIYPTLSVIVDNIFTVLNKAWGSKINTLSLGVYELDF